MDELRLNQALSIVVRETLPARVQAQLEQQRAEIAELERVSGWRVAACGHGIHQEESRYASRYCACRKPSCAGCLLKCDFSIACCDARFCAACDSRQRLECGCVMCADCAGRRKLCACGEPICWTHVYAHRTTADGRHARYLKRCQEEQPLQPPSCAAEPRAEEAVRAFGCQLF